MNMWNYTYTWIVHNFWNYWPVKVKIGQTAKWVCWLLKWWFSYSSSKLVEMDLKVWVLAWGPGVRILSRDLLMRISKVALLRAHLSLDPSQKLQDSLVWKSNFTNSLWEPMPVYLHDFGANSLWNTLRISAQERGIFQRLWNMF